MRKDIGQQVDWENPGADLGPKSDRVNGSIQPRDCLFSILRMNWSTTGREGPENDFWKEAVGGNLSWILAHVEFSSSIQMKGYPERKFYS
jgi:hypothetical protein